MISKSVFIKKKRIMEKFNLEKYLANPSRKVVTRAGRNARIICTDRRDLTFPIIALIENKSGLGETTIYYTKDGKFYINGSADYDLFFAPEKHEGYVNVYRSLDKDCAYYLGNIYNSKAEAEDTRENKKFKYIDTIKIEWEE